MTEDLTTRSLKDLASHVNIHLPGIIVKNTIFNQELTLIIKPDSLLNMLEFLRHDADCNFTQLVDICGVDYPNRPNRFEVVYNLLSMKRNQRIRLKISTDEDTAITSATAIFPSAIWAEREVWDLFGIKFKGHPDHRRILTDYGFDGHPLRKDFPLTGHVEMRWSEEQQRILYEPVKLQQEFRQFDALSPWEGMTTVQLPGDEKARKPETGYDAFRREFGLPVNDQVQNDDQLEKKK